MSVPVGLDQLRAEIARFGPAPYLITVTADGHPHAVSVRVEWDGDDLVVPAGRGTLANAARRPAVTLLWPPMDDEGFSLIADGTATADSEHEVVAVRPTKAVLHRSGQTPNCVPVLDA